MINNYSNIIKLEKNNLVSIVHSFMEKIKEAAEEVKFIRFVENSNKLIDSLIDICIKNKINYFIKNHISFSSIKSNFTIELENILLNFASKMYPDIEKNIVNIRVNDLNVTETLEQWNNILLTLSRRQDTKNKVSFSPTVTQYTYKLDEGQSKKPKKRSKPVKIDLFGDVECQELTIDYRISIFLKVIFINFLDIRGLEEHIYSACQILNDISLEYDVLQPYKNKF